MLTQCLRLPTFSKARRKLPASKKYKPSKFSRKVLSLFFYCFSNTTPSPLPLGRHLPRPHPWLPVLSAHTLLLVLLIHSPALNYFFFFHPLCTFTSTHHGAGAGSLPQRCNHICQSEFVRWAFPLLLQMTPEFSQALKCSSIFLSLLCPHIQSLNSFLLVIPWESLFTLSIPFCSHCHRRVRHLICSCPDFYNGLPTSSFSSYNSVESPATCGYFSAPTVKSCK